MLHGDGHVDMGMAQRIASTPQIFFKLLSKYEFLD